MSAKTQKLFLNQSAADGFQGYAVRDEDHPGDKPDTAFAAGGGAPGLPSFGLPQVFWNWVKTDPQVALQLELLIETRVNEQLRVRLAEEREGARVQGLAEGLDTGRAAAKTERDAQLATFEALCQSILAKESNLMREHESLWLGLLRHILQRFLVPNRDLALADIEKWMSEGLASFEQQGAVKLYLGEDDFRKWEALSRERKPKHLEVHQDILLKDGEIRCESNAGGIFFSSEDERARLFETLDRYITGTQANGT